MTRSAAEAESQFASGVTKARRSLPGYHASLALRPIIAPIGASASSENTWNGYYAGINEMKKRLAPFIRRPSRRVLESTPSSLTA